MERSEERESYEDGICLGEQQHLRRKENATCEDERHWNFENKHCLLSQWPFVITKDWYTQS